jgi:hypothetical protein
MRAGRTQRCACEKADPEERGVEPVPPACVVSVPANLPQKFETGPRMTVGAEKGRANVGESDYLTSGRDI